VPFRSPLLLASTSPYRRRLLERLGLEFSVEAPGIAESPLEDEAPAARAARLAVAKAQAVSARHPLAVVVGSDQVAAAGDVILDKPGHEAAAQAQLARLSAAAAHFHTACTVVRANPPFSASHLDTTRVAFRTLGPEEIGRYVARERPLDCAGSFKVEGLGISLLQHFEAEDPTGLIGLPLIWLAATLRHLGYEVP
jgi:septum formation protein